MTYFNKVRWGAGVLLVFLVVVSTNLINRTNYNKLSNSVSTIYKDRIVASDFLFDMAMLIHRKKVAVVTGDNSFFKNENPQVNLDLDLLIASYAQTKLTENESKLFYVLKSELDKMKALEKGDIVSSKKALNETIEKVIQTLKKLSKIQLEEGRIEMFTSNKAKNAVDLFTQIEVIFLIIMAGIIQIIIFYKPKEEN